MVWSKSKKDFMLFSYNKKNVNGKCWYIIFDGILVYFKIELFILLLFVNLAMRNTTKCIYNTEYWEKMQKKYKENDFFSDFFFLFRRENFSFLFLGYVWVTNLKSCIIQSVNKRVCVCMVCVSRTITQWLCVLSCGRKKAFHHHIHTRNNTITEEEKKLCFRILTLHTRISINKIETNMFYFILLVFRYYFFVPCIKFLGLHVSI